MGSCLDPELPGNGLQKRGDVVRGLPHSGKKESVGTQQRWRKHEEETEKNPFRTDEEDQWPTE
jgi:hypothetical protein